MSETMADHEFLPVAVRVWPQSEQSDGRPVRKRSRVFRPRRILAIDTETTVDTAQSLTFGSARLCRLVRKSQYEAIKEVMFYADDLSVTDPTGYQILTDYCDIRKLECVPRSHFVENYVRKYCEARTGPNGRPSGTAMMVFFNLPFDISRLAEDYGYARGHMSDGFSFRMFPLHDGIENRYRRRIKVKHIDSKKSLVSWGSSLDGSKDPDMGEHGPGRSGQFLDLRTLVWALTNESCSLARACELLNVETSQRKTKAERHGIITLDYIDYNRQDVAATVGLAERAFEDHFKHTSINLAPSKAYSPASYGKAYYRAMGITPVMSRPDVPKDDVFMGNATSTFYGGRAETHIRKTPVPVQVNDYTSMYPTVNILMGLWDLLTSDVIESVDVTSELQTMLDSLTVEDVLNPERWRTFAGVAQIRPDGDILPVRADYDGNGTYNVGVNRLHSAEPLWYSIPDIVASTLLTGRAPTVMRAIRLVPVGEKLSTLATVDFPGCAVRIDPASVDFFKEVIELRQNVKREAKGHPPYCPCERCKTERTLKVVANATSYGISVEMLREDSPEFHEQTVYGPFGPKTSKVTAHDTAQEFCYPPIGTCITGAARLMLALFERLVTDAGGTWLFCDTDSMAVVANEDGCLVPCEGGTHVLDDGRAAVRALSYEKVRDIRETLNRLNPYDRQAVPDVLKVEYQCYGYAVSAKRYVLFELDDRRPVITDGGKASEHGLGMYLNPTDPQSDDRNWIRQLWQHVLDNVYSIECECRGNARTSCSRVPWLGVPALARVAVTSPHLARVFEGFNEGRSYAEQVKPFNFLLMASKAPHSRLRHSDHMYGLDADDGYERLLAPYTTDPNEWLTCEWRDVRDRDAPPIRVETGLQSPDRIGIKSFRDVRVAFLIHAERKASAPDGSPSTSRTVGLLGRRTVRPSWFRYIGKEMNRLEEFYAGLLTDPTEVFTDYGPVDVLRSYILPALKHVGNRELSRRVNGEGVTTCDAMRIGRLRKGASVGSETSRALLHIAAREVSGRDDIGSDAIAAGILLNSRPVNRDGR